MYVCGQIPRVVQFSQFLIKDTNEMKKNAEDLLEI
jgi:hypothetical protein